MHELAAELFNRLTDFGALLPRFSWVHFASAAIIAITVFYLRQPRGARSLGGAIKAAFRRRVFLHRSALVDYKFAAINHVLQLLLYGVFILNAITVTEWCAELMSLAFGEREHGSVPSPVVGALLITLMMLAVDGGFFAAHWLQHKVPVLWEFHKVHHSAEVLTPITVLRMHPVDVILNALLPGLLVGAVHGACVYAYPDDAETLQFGAHLFNAVFFVCGYHLRHSHVWILFPRWIGAHISSPALHQIHHSKNPKHFDKNLARVFTFWDRLAGTLYIPERHEEIKFGLGGDEHLAFNSVWQLYILPFRNLAARYGPSHPFRRRGADVADRAG